MLYRKQSLERACSLTIITDGRSADRAARSPEVDAQVHLGR
jgi:hypothetical protein